jgi:AcrR family transcriptional regulator
MTVDISARVRRRLKHARTKELRDVALALFVEQGFNATLTEDIAARAGVSKGTLYLYYPSKEKLLKAAIASPAQKALAKVRPMAERVGNSTVVLRRVLSDVWAQLQDETVGSVVELAVAEARRFPEIMEVWLRKVARLLHSLIADVVLRGMDRDEFRQMAADVVAHSLLLPMFMLCLQRRVMDTGSSTDRCLDDGYIPQHVELVLIGLHAVSE